MVVARMKIGYWIHYWGQMVAEGHVLEVVGVLRILVGAFHIHQAHHWVVPIAHLRGEVLPCEGEVGACSSFLLMKSGVVHHEVVLWYLGVGAVALLMADPNCPHSLLVAVEALSVRLVLVRGLVQVVPLEVLGLWGVHQTFFQGVLNYCANAVCHPCHDLVLLNEEVLKGVQEGVLWDLVPLLTQPSKTYTLHP